MAYDPINKRIATASADKTLMVWDTSSDFQQVSTMKGHRAEISRANFSPVTGDFLVTASQDGTARLWNVPTGNCAQVLTGHKDEVFACIFSYCGKKIITASKDNTAVIWA